MGCLQGAESFAKMEFRFPSLTGFRFDSPVTGEFPRRIHGQMAETRSRISPALEVSSRIGFPDMGTERDPHERERLPGIRALRNHMVGKRPACHFSRGHESRVADFNVRPRMGTLGASTGLISGLRRRLCREANRSREGHGPVPPRCALTPLENHRALSTNAQAASEVRGSPRRGYPP